MSYLAAVHGRKTRSTCRIEWRCEAEPYCGCPDGEPDLRHTRRCRSRRAEAFGRAGSEAKSPDHRGPVGRTPSQSPGRQVQREPRDRALSRPLLPRVPDGEMADRRRQHAALRHQQSRPGALALRGDVHLRPRPARAAVPGVAQAPVAGRSASYPSSGRCPTAGRCRMATSSCRPGSDGGQTLTF